MMITVYVLKGSSGKRYIGITNNLDRHLIEHRSRKTKGGQLLGDFIVLYTEEYPDYKSARKREKFFKSGVGRRYLDSIDFRTGSAKGG